MEQNDILNKIDDLEKRIVNLEKINKKQKTKKRIYYTVIIILTLVFVFIYYFVFLKFISELF